jgi:multidrug efflux pump subunit AcrA (membrane-fusion protein)
MNTKTPATLNAQLSTLNAQATERRMDTMRQHTVFHGGSNGTPQLNLPTDNTDHTDSESPRRLLFSQAGLALLLLAAGCGGGKADAEPSGRPVGPAVPEAGRAALPVKVVAAAARDFERRFTVQGTLEAKHYANVAARVGGNLDAIWVDDGDRVEAGRTRLFQIDPVTLSNAVVSAEKELAVARATLKVNEAAADKAETEFKKAELDYRRYARLHEKGTVTDNEYETYETAYAAGRASVRLARSQVDLAAAQAGRAGAALQTARKNLADSLIAAPVSGIVHRRAAEPGEQLAVGQVVLRIDDPSVVEASAYLPAPFYREVEAGKTAFQLAANREPVGRYTVSYRSPTIDTTLRTFEVKGLVRDNPKAVPGDMAEFTFVFETRKGLAVPDASVLERLNRRVVFVEKDGKARMTDVKTGLRNDGWTEILEGLNEGDRVLSEGQSQATDGAAVEVH